MPGARKLGRTTDHRKAMLRAMVTFLLENGKIETTVTRAKEVRAMAEKMITIAKANDLHSKRQVYSYITKETVAKKVMDEIAPKYADRNGGEIYEQFSQMTAGKTAVYISHRMSSCKFCDRIIVLDHGRIAEDGTHDTLLANHGIYANLYETQAQYYT